MSRPRRTRPSRPTPSRTRRPRSTRRPRRPLTASRPTPLPPSNFPPAILLFIEALALRRGGFVFHDVPRWEDGDTITGYRRARTRSLVSPDGLRPPGSFL